MDPTAQELSGFTNLQEVLDWVGFADDGDRKTWSSFSQALGKPKMVRQLAAIPYAAYEKTVKDWKVPDGKDATAALTEPTPVELGHVGLLRRCARLSLNLNPDEGVAPAPSAATGGLALQISNAVQAAMPTAPSSSSNKVTMSKVLDQADDSEITLLDPQMYDTLVEAWKIAENDGEEPTEEEEATRTQLSALNIRIKSGAICFVDFALWRPFGDRLGRALKFTVHTMRPDGTVAAKEVNGPPDFFAWSRSWKVFAFAMAALGQGTRTRMARYHDRIQKLHEEYPNHWWIVGLADIRMRSEYLDRVRRDCVRRYTAGKLAEFDPSKPWDIIFREAALDTGYWGREVDKKVFLHLTNLASTAKIADEGFGVLEEAGQTLKSHGSSHGQGGKKRRSRSSSSSPQRTVKPRKPTKPTKPVKGPGKKGAGKGAGKGKGQPTQQQADGKYFKINGTQVCFAYNRAQGGCSEICPDARAHLCEKCTGKHRAIDCLVVPKKNA